MAKTKDDIRAQGRAGYYNETVNPYKEGSWQYNAWNEGHEAALQGAAQTRHETAQERHAESRAPGVTVGDQLRNLPRDTVAGICIPFPERMPSATREHIRRLEASQASKLADGSYLARTAKKILKLYEKWA